MKAMNEFESLIVIATLILVVCTVMDPPLSLPDAGIGRQGNDHSASGVTQSFDHAKQGSYDSPGSGAVLEPVSMEAGNRRGPAPMLLTRSPRQPGTSW